MTAAELRAQAEHLVALADSEGYQLTIERRPLLPLHMGNTAPAITIWPRRHGGRDDALGSMLVRISTTEQLILPVGVRVERVG